MRAPPPKIAKSIYVIACLVPSPFSPDHTATPQKVPVHLFHHLLISRLDYHRSFSLLLPTTPIMYTHTIRVDSLIASHPVHISFNCSAMPSVAPSRYSDSCETLKRFT